MSLSSVIREVCFIDSTTGAGKTGLAFGDITAVYNVEGGTDVALTTEDITVLGTYQAPTSSSHIRLKKKSDSNPSQGIVEVHFHNTQVAAAGKKLWLKMSASGALDVRFELDLVADTITTYTGNTPQTGDSYARLGSPAGASIAADIAAKPSAATIAAAVWDFATASMNTVGSIGKWILDKFSSTTFPSGTVASSTEVTAIQNNTRTVIVVPDVIERPDSGTDTYLIHLYLYDENGNMETPDAAPTVALTNSGGTDRSGRLDSTTGALVNTGHYKWTYTNTSTDTLEQLLWEFSVVEGGATRLFGRTTLLVDATAVDFTSADRTVLNAAATAVALAAVNTKLGTPANSTVSQDIADVLSAVESIDAGGGSGNRTITFTINDGANPLQGATLFAKVNDETVARGTTAANGTVPLDLNDGTNKMVPMLSGYIFTPEDLVVSSTLPAGHVKTYSMTRITPTPSDPDKTTGYLGCLDEYGQPLAGVTYQLFARAAFSTGLGIDRAVREATSAASTGLVEFTNLLASGKYSYRRGTTGPWVDITIPADPDATTELSSCIGD